MAAEIHRRGGYAVTFAGNMPGHRPPPSAYTVAEIEPLQLAVKLAKREADERDADLLAVIQEAARRVPRQSPAPT